MFRAIRRFLVKLLRFLVGEDNPPPIQSQLDLLARQSNLTGEANIPPIYSRNRSLFTFGEKRFYFAVFHNTDGFAYHVALKVRVADVVWLSNEPTNKQMHNNRMFGKHFDFVLCDKHRFEPLLVIELDDSSHRKTDRKESDKFKDALCEQVGLPILRIKTASEYDVPAIWGLIREKLDVE